MCNSDESYKGKIHNVSMHNWGFDQSERLREGFWEVTTELGVKRSVELTRQNKREKCSRDWNNV